MGHPICYLQVFPSQNHNLLSLSVCYSVPDLFLMNPSPGVSNLTTASAQESISLIQGLLMSWGKRQIRTTVINNRKTNILASCQADNKTAASSRNPSSRLLRTPSHGRTRAIEWGKRKQRATTEERRSSTPRFRENR